MATTNKTIGNIFPFDFGLPLKPFSKDERILQELEPIYNAINVLAGQIGHRVQCKFLEAASPGDMVYIPTGDPTSARYAQAGASRPVRGVYVGREDIAVGDVGEVHLFGLVLYPADNLHTGEEYFLSDSVPGGITLTQFPSAGGQNQRVGYAVATSLLFFHPDLHYLD